VEVSLSCHTLGTKLKWAVYLNSHLHRPPQGRFTPKNRASLQYPLNRRLGGPPKRFWTFYRKTSLTLMGLEPQIRQPVDYTDYVIPAPAKPQRKINP
jgi:hypothetical protein